MSLGLRQLLLRRAVLGGGLPPAIAADINQSTRSSHSPPPSYLRQFFFLRSRLIRTNRHTAANIASSLLGGDKSVDGYMDRWAAGSADRWIGDSVDRCVQSNPISQGLLKSRAGTRHSIAGRAAPSRECQEAGTHSRTIVRDIFWRAPAVAAPAPSGAAPDTTRILRSRREVQPGR